MAQLARLPNSVLYYFLIVLCGCNSTVHERNETSIQVNKANANCKFVDGLLKVNDMLFTGELYTLFPNTADTADIENYYHGKENGGWRKYYEDGKIKEIRQFSMGKKTGDYIGFWQNGNRQLHYTFENDDYEGNCKEWNEAGLLTKDMNYVKSREEGLQRWWYDNGKIKANYLIKDGRRYGLLGTKNCINVSDSIFKK